MDRGNKAVTEDGKHGYPGQWCVHYLPPNQYDACEAGVRYETLSGIPHRQRPCFLDRGVSRPGAVHCPHLRRPTPEEIAAYSTWSERDADRVLLALVALATLRKTYRGRAGQIPCPACKSGMLKFSIAASNGHCSAQCSTPDCVAFME